jgi:hypothetical protein
LKLIQHELVRTIKLLPLIVKILGLFIASLAPLMFLVGLIAGLDRWGTHTRFLDRLEAYGKTTEARVSYVDQEYNRAGLDFVDSAGQQRYGTLDFRYYPPDVVKTIRQGSKLQVVYIDALVSESEKTALAEYYDEVRAAPAVTADIWWLLGITWLLIAFYPQFTFLGFADLDKLLIPTPRA